MVGTEPIVLFTEDTKVSFVVGSEDREWFLVIDFESRPVGAPRPVGPHIIASIFGSLEDALAHSGRDVTRGRSRPSPGHLLARASVRCNRLYLGARSVPCILIPAPRTT